jgi:hypothetical protein
VSPAAILFRVGAFVALVLLVRYARRTEGARAGTLLVAYLVGMSAVREVVVASISHAIDKPVPYQADAKLGHLGLVNVVVVAGWVFTALLSFAIARLIQRRSFPGTNVFLTLALTALVTTAISYTVELTGMRIALWKWNEVHPVSWLPFEWPFDAFEGWASTSFMIMLVYATVRWRLFSPSRVRRTATLLALCAIFVGADLLTPVLGPESPRKKVTLVYVVGAVLLGFWAPRGLLGSSEEAPEPEGAPAG